MSGEEGRCEKLWIYYCGPILEFVKWSVLTYKKMIIMFYLVFLIPLTIFMLSDESYISKTEVSGVYVATLFFLHVIIRNNTREYYSFIEAINQNDLDALKKSIFTMDILTYIQKLCVFLPEGDLENAEKLINSMSFKLNVDWSTSNKKFKSMLKELRKNIDICLRTKGRR